MNQHRDCLTEVLCALILGAGLAVVLCAVLLNGHGQLYEEMERTKNLSQPFVGPSANGYVYIPRVPGSYASERQAGQCAQLDPGGGMHRIECPKVQP